MANALFTSALGWSMLRSTFADTARRGKFLLGAACRFVPEMMDNAAISGILQVC
jgi:hypothetical protein